MHLQYLRFFWFYTIIQTIRQAIELFYANFTNNTLRNIRRTKMRYGKITAVVLAAIMTFSALPFTTFAQNGAPDAVKTEAQSEEFISLPFASYVNEISSGRDTAYLENVVKDGKDVVMCTPNPKSEATTSTITIDGYKYKPANINLDEYRWIAIEYYYQSPEPIEDLCMNITLTGLGGLLKEGMGGDAKSQDVVAANTWAVAVFDMNTVIDTALNPEVSHIRNSFTFSPTAEAQEICSGKRMLCTSAELCSSRDSRISILILPI